MAGRQRRRLEDGRAGEVRRFERPAVARARERRVDALEPSELFRAASRLLRPLSRPEPVDVLLGPRDLFLLAGRGPRERRVTARALSGVLRVPAAVLDDLGSLRRRLERQRARGDPVEEPAVVRRREHRRVLIHEKGLEPLERGDVEVVRRLVQQQEIGIVEQQPSEAETRPLPAGERSHVAVTEHVQTEAREDPAEGRVEVVPAGVLELMLCVRISLQELGVAAREVLLHRA